MIKYYFFVLLFLLVSINLRAQTNEEKFTVADYLIEDGNFHKALAIYLELLGEYPNNANLNFKIGYCYLNTATEKVKAIPYLEYASKHIVNDYKIADFNELGAPVEAFYYLGKAYHVNYRFDDAEKSFIDLKELLGPKDNDFKVVVNNDLNACQVARVLINNPIEMDVTNLGSNINSKYTEHSPVISGDESLLIFTSTREGNTGGRIMDDGQYFEDIYISSFDGEKYTQAQKISKNINTSWHEASIGLSFDGTKLFIYKGDNKNGDIYVSERKGSEWLTPEMLPEPINSKYRETHASMSFDKNEIYFTSDRKGGYGGLDIYRVRKLPNGKWSKAQNMGATINTEYDEEGPYLHPDGTSLFFSSDGHNTMGGFDIFISYVDENDKWSIPKNIGYPINTPDDDVYYMPSVDGRRAYYASHTHNSIGNYDLFRIDLSETHVRNQTVIAGYAVSPDNILLEDAIITITDLDDEVVGIYTPDSETKKFLFILHRGRTFNVLFESSNEDDFECTIIVPNYAYDQSKQVVIFNEIIIGVKKDYELEVELLVENTPKEENVNAEDNLSLDSENIESKSIAGEQEETNEITSGELLIANELYENDKYIEATIEDSLQSDLGNDKDSLVNELSDEYSSDNSYLEAGNSINANSPSSSKTNTIILEILFGLLLVGSAIYLVLKRKNR